MEFDGEDMIDSLVESDDDLWTEWELNFIKSMGNSDWDDLTEEQQNKVIELHNKLLREQP
jgi:hypothetical protein